MIEDIDSYSNYLIPLLLACLGGLGYIIKRQHEKIKDIKASLSEKKYNLYMKLLNLMFEGLKFTGNERQIQKLFRREFFIDIKKELLIYAPDHIVSKFIEWHISNKEENHIKNSSKLFEMYVMIRKDMGQPKTKIHVSDILDLITGNQTETNKLLREMDGM